VSHKALTKKKVKTQLPLYAPCLQEIKNYLEKTAKHATTQKPNKHHKRDSTVYGLNNGEISQKNTSALIHFRGRIIF
jgi:hypothetical protein